MKKETSFKIAYLTFSIIVICFAVASFAIAQWTEPSSPPPGSNMAIPLNISLTGQIKEGGLLLGNSSSVTNGLIVRYGNVGIGTTAPSANYQLHIAGTGTPAGEILLEGPTGTSSVGINFKIDGIPDTFSLKHIPAGSLIFGASVGGVGTRLMTLQSNGNVGIGTTAPQGVLSIENLMADNMEALRIDTDGSEMRLYSYSDTPGKKLDIEFRRAGGSIGSPTGVADGDSLGEIRWFGYNEDGSDYDYGARIGVRIDGTPSSGSDGSDMPAALSFYTTADGSGGSTERMTIKSNGNVGIGTTNPGGDRLDVRGRAYASGGWQTTDADYAEWFEKEEDTIPGDIIGINLQTGKVRKYRPGDRFIGIHTTNGAVVGNRLMETDEEMSQNHTLIGLIGQLDFDRTQVVIEGRIVRSKDNKEIGLLLSNGKLFLD